MVPIDSTIATALGALLALIATIVPAVLARVLVEAASAGPTSAQKTVERDVLARWHKRREVVSILVATVSIIIWWLALFCLHFAARTSLPKSPFVFFFRAWGLPTSSNIFWNGDCRIGGRHRASTNTPRQLCHASTVRSRSGLNKSPGNGECHVRLDSVGGFDRRILVYKLSRILQP